MGITFGWVATFAESVAVVTAFTEVAKLVFEVRKPKVAALLSAAFVTFGLQLLYYMDFSLQAFFMSCITTVFVTLSAIGAYEYCVKPVERKLVTNKKGDE